MKSSAYPNGLSVAARRNDGKAQNQLLHHSQFRQSGYRIHGNDHEELHCIKPQKIIDENHIPRGHSSKGLHEMKPPNFQLHYNCSQIKDHSRGMQILMAMAIISDCGNSSHSAA
ncbi:hypothetical protein SAY86_026950 [Trapa natans]|uniref:Uncharacterized protein n=1 Tax=Trapa natans TaxID=22666 RepID=A0AAN7QLL0_TRANT|nr:hypothetical protein SAY86_026950 [Trapa natans]